MDLSKKAYANSLILNARLQAFENFFWGYLKVIEKKEDAIFFQKMFLEFYASNVEKLQLHKPIALDVEIMEYVQSEQKEANRHIDDLENLSS